MGLSCWWGLALQVQVASTSEIRMNFRRGASGVLEAGASEPHTEAPPLLAGGFQQYGVLEVGGCDDFQETVSV
jgi:hypothetical protein